MFCPKIKKSTCYHENAFTSRKGILDLMTFLGATDADDYLIYFSSDLFQDFVMPEMIWLEPSKIQSPEHITLVAWQPVLDQAVSRLKAVVEVAVAGWQRLSLRPTV